MRTKFVLLIVRLYLPLSASCWSNQLTQKFHWTRTWCFLFSRKRHISMHQPRKSQLTTSKLHQRAFASAAVHSAKTHSTRMRNVSSDSAHRAFHIGSIQVPVGKSAFLKLCLPSLVTLQKTPPKFMRQHHARQGKKVGGLFHTGRRLTQAESKSTHS